MLSLALAYLLNGQNEESIRILEGLPEESDGSDLHRAVFLGTAYRLAGQMKEGIALLSSVKWNHPSLLRLETSRIQELLAPIDEAINREKAEREKG